jgi:hypothetical protein
VRDRLIRLGPPQLVIVAVGLLTVLFIAYEAEWPLWDDVYTRAYALPGMEERWGFRFGTFRVRLNEAEHEYSGIISVAPDGRLARLGLRPHDMPVQLGSAHGTPASVVLYRALLASERGEATTFDVANADDWAAGRGNRAFRQIDIQPAR